MWHESGSRFCEPARSHSDLSRLGCTVQEAECRMEGEKYFVCVVVSCNMFALSEYNHARRSVCRPRHGSPLRRIFHNSADPQSPSISISHFLIRSVLLKLHITERVFNSSHESSILEMKTWCFSSFVLGSKKKGTHYSA